MLEIPKEEFEKRIKKLQEKMNEENLDIVIAHSNEADPANVRYLSDFWPVFETAGVVVPKEGEPILLVGPECETFALSRSKIRKVRKLIEYRESAEPEYPGVPVSTFEEVFKEVVNGRKVERIGLIGYAIMPLPIYESIRRALPEASIVKADSIMRELRSIKSEGEIALQREAFRISEIALEKVIENIKPGMTELQVVGIIQETIYKNGAEYEGFPIYVLSGKNTAFAICRPSHRVLEKGDLVQLDIGARVGGYSSSIGRPIFLGKMPSNIKSLVEVGLEAQEEVIRSMKAGIEAKEVAKRYYDFVKRKGFEENILYGPCHGLGLLETEFPWIELNSNYILKENMTFEVDIFLYTKDFGLRWEDGVRVIKDGVEEYSSKRKEIIEIE